MIVFGSRGSELAMTQTKAIAARLQAVTGEPFEIVHVETTGDRVLERPLDAIGVKGAFTVELEEALRSGRIDVAVHSLKDLPVEDAAGLCLGAVPERVDPRDVLLARAGAVDEAGGALPLVHGARVGTSSPRRRYSFLALRQDLELADVRGNVPTRAHKVARGDYDATLLAAAGLDRLQLDLGDLVRLPLPPSWFPPAPGQGALAVQCRADDARVRALLATIHDAAAARCVAAERTLLLGLGGGCSLPLGALCTPDGDGFRLQAALFAPSGAALRCDRRTHDIDGLVATLAASWSLLRAAPLQGVALLLPRPDGDGGELAEALRFCGAEVEVATWTRTEPITPGAGEVAQLFAADAFACSSVRAVEGLQALAAGIGRGLPATARWFAVGEATAAALRQHGIEPMLADGSGGAMLAALVRRNLPAGGKLAYPCALGRHPAFEAECAIAGLQVDAVPLYRTVPVARPAAPQRRPDFVLFTAPSAVAALAQQFADLRQLPCIAIGTTTAAALRQDGITPAAIAAAADPQHIVEAIAKVRS